MREPFKYVDGILYLQAWKELGNITAGFTTKDGGISTGSFHAMNLGLHVNDIVENVHENRRILANKLQNHWKTGFALNKFMITRLKK